MPILICEIKRLTVFDSNSLTRFRTEFLPPFLTIETKLCSLFFGIFSLFETATSDFDRRSRPLRLRNLLRDSLLLQGLSSSTNPTFLFDLDDFVDIL